MKTFLQIVAIILGGFSILMSIPLLMRLHWPSPALWFCKLLASTLSMFFVLTGMLIIIVGISTNSPFISLAGIYVVLIFLTHAFRITRPPNRATGFDRAFGLHWMDRIHPEQKVGFLSSRAVFRLPKVPKPRMQQNVSFSIIPGTDRHLLCDVWEPNEHVTRSGLAFIFLHGSAFYFLDKDLGTRPFFTHLTAQGHVIMDVAYRLSPETDMMGMIHDVKRSIAWMKQNAGIYGVDPDRIVVGGGSAGGHLALLAAYTTNDLQFTPKELEGKDTSVSAAISLYGTTDLKAVYYHTNQHLTTRGAPGRPKKRVPTKMPRWIIKRMGSEYHRLGLDKGFENAGALAPLLGGHPDECPETYAFYSPVAHVHSKCPPTLLIHGEHDIMAPVNSVRILYNRLVANNVPTVMHILPQTDHAFDMVIPKISPSTHNVFYDVERFLAVQLIDFHIERHHEPVAMSQTQ